MVQLVVFPLLDCSPLENLFRVKACCYDWSSGMQCWKQGVRLQSNASVTLATLALTGI